MRLRERLLYHQVHPLKLATDPLAGAVALALLWRQERRRALTALLVPTASVSSGLIVFADLRREQHSDGGAYMRRYQTLPVQAVRFVAFGVAMWGADKRRETPLVAGGSLVALCWLYGLFWPAKHRPTGTGG